MKKVFGKLYNFFKQLLDDGKQDKETERNRNQFTPTDDSGLILQELKNKKDGKGIN